MRIPVCHGSGALATLLVVLALPPAVLAGQGSELPTVRLVATGGTISNRSGGRLTPEELVSSVPTLAQYVQAETEQFSNIASSDLTLDQWLALSRRVNELFDSRPELAGIVVSSGTDTLEETAYFLHLTVRSNRPVVVVGSMRRPEALGYDGAANLLQAFRVAAAPASVNRGVLVVMNNEINSAREVVKTDSGRLQAFDTRGYGVLGTVDAGAIHYYRRTERRHTRASEFDVRGLDSLPRVDVLLSYQDAPGDLIRAAVESGAAGLVIAGAGAGATSPSQREALRDVLENEIVVVITTRTGGGRVAPRRRPVSTEDRDDEDGEEDGSRFSPYRVAGQDLTPVKARILLMLALTRTKAGAEIQRMFEEY
jgi:L-asparaginase